MLIDCPTCRVSVDAEVLFEIEHAPDPEGSMPPSKYLTLRCDSCNEIIFATQDYTVTRDYSILRHKRKKGVTWGKAVRVWPQPDPNIDFPISVPFGVRDSILEAHRCFNAQAYSACAVMCGRALEATCKHFKTNSSTLNRGLEELKQQGIIDDRLFTWASELRLLRNIGAHATDENITEDDADDLLDFVNAICQYVFVLSNKFEKFQNRRKKVATKALHNEEDIPF